MAMTTYYVFEPQEANPPYQFQPSMDDNNYIARVTWNAFGQRWYIGLYTNNGIMIFMQAMAGSPQLLTVQSIWWADGFVHVKAVFPAAFHVGDTFHLTLSGFVPEDYNRSRTLAVVIKPDEITYPMSSPPLPATVLGRATYDINLGGGYYTRSTLVYRVASQQFEAWAP